MRRLLAAALCALCLSACDNLAYDYGASGRDADGGADGGTDGGLLPDGGHRFGGHPGGQRDLSCAPGFDSCGGAICGADLSTDPEHCGACDQGCGAGRCVKGACAP